MVGCYIKLFKSIFLLSIVNVGSAVSKYILLRFKDKRRQRDNQELGKTEPPVV